MCESHTALVRYARARHGLPLALMVCAPRRPNRSLGEEPSGPNHRPLTPLPPLASPGAATPRWNRYPDFAERSWLVRPARGPEHLCIAPDDICG